MRYMLLVYTNENANANRTPEQAREIIDGHYAAMTEATRRGYLRGAEPLFPTSSATTVRQQSDGVYLTTDGPFAETKEQLAGYYILECDNLDEAIDIARRVPTGCGGGAGCIEIRPIQALPQPISANAATGQSRA